MSEGADQGGATAVAVAKARKHAVKKFGRVAMRISNESGGLRGTVIPHPKAPKREHPWIKGQVMDPALDTEINNILRDSTSYDDFIKKLENWGYFVEPER